MKIIHVLAGKANPKTTMNGVNVEVDAYASMMHRAGLEVEVWGIANNPYTNLPTPPYALRLFRHLHGWPTRLDPALVKQLKQVDCGQTVFHFHSGFLPPFARIVSLLDRPAYFCMPQGVYSEGCLKLRRWRKWVYFYLMERRFLKQSRGVLLAQPHELSDWFDRALNGTPRYIIPNGADTGVEMTDQNTKSLWNQPTVWGFCGRIHDDHKAVDRMVRCFVKFTRRRPAEKHILSLIGDGPDLPMIRRRYSREIDSGAVQIHGSLFGEEKHEQMRKMHYFIHVSNWEGVPLSCLEAAAMGLPLLVTPGTNMAEDVEQFHAGAATPAGDEDIVAAMGTLVDDDRTALREGCRRLIEEKYSWQRSTERLIGLYEEALRG